MSVSLVFVCFGEKIYLQSCCNDNVKKYLTSPTCTTIAPYYYIAFASAAEMTDAEKAAEEAAMKTAEQEMMESAAPYTPPEGKLITFFSTAPYIMLSN